MFRALGLVIALHGARGLEWDYKSSGHGREVLHLAFTSPGRSLKSIELGCSSNCL